MFVVLMPELNEEEFAKAKATVLPPEFDAVDRTVLLAGMDECRHHNGLTAEEVVPAIQAGLADANAALAADYVVERVEIVESDSRQPGIYEYLTRKIIEKAAEADQSNGSTADIDYAGAAKVRFSAISLRSSQSAHGQVPPALTRRVHDGEG